MKFKALTGNPSLNREPAPSAEEVFANYRLWLAEVCPIFTVQTILETDDSFVLTTAFFRVRCSKKFVSVAKSIKGYLNSLESSTGQVGIPLLMLTGFNDRDYVRYEFGCDDEEEFTAYPVLKCYDDGGKLMVFYSELPSPEPAWVNSKFYALRPEEIELFASKQPDPQNPQKRQSIARAKKTAQAKPLG